ncbi:peptidase Do family protein [Ehrlichia chaffeensis str. Heartland]|uniref:Probable periplasmic serine endoprotease DegP-like n=1 Tax=Ehrlichia chaffeensis (strain ATCC CRL-10679 / Arkansas) TaxID=205920 RepID=Q2GFE6_EHRCR|nr:Do family serine endopeptidase [Ehrlichia chaffeensis]ABD44943.1 serine protease, DO/DeqQ family [Ehrlichia chaffeensis str. Arkansas]AHX03296.1 peptidase Do family protein [Ehrlichia chaffeensis str. Heartland]AHX05213.1 peptidase Do family protein [Ehrlichia chaffeensis str. Jax]AHX06202.1 peptidase Do family protein [Ehrlichia chaffeensis str. Liberty]AHX07280.1 peptidase Do family protein [Ehrlichia chaffeensis str. Osceola]
MKRFLLLILVLILANVPIGSFADQKAEQYDPRSGFSKLIKESTPAVVNISIVHDLIQEQFPLITLEELLRNILEGKPVKKDIPQEVLSAGSGFVVDESGIIVTNYHVVHNAKEVYVTFSDNKSIPAKILGVDPQTDLAVLKVEVNEKLPYLEFGDSDKTMVGDWVVAIGNPFGLGGSASIGIISARARDLNIGTATEFLQTDAAINKGNSGGPLFNIDGKVIGINTAILSTQKGGGNIGVGFAIPSNNAVSIIKVLSQGKKVEHGWLGVVMQPITEELVEPLQLKEVGGALITNVVKGSPASKANLLPGDIILEFNGTKINSISQLHQLVLRSEADNEVKLLVSRNGSIISILVKIGKFENPDISENGMPKDAIQSPELGLTVGSVQRNNIYNNIEEEEAKGVVILDIDSTSNASTRNIRKGDIILQINQSPVNNLEDFKNVMKKVRKNKSVALLISRDNISAFVTVKLKQ